MKINKIMILTIVLLAILSFGAVSAQDDLTKDISTSNGDIIHKSQSTKLDSTGENNLASDNDQSFYVDTAGSDSAAGTQNAPFSTIKKAISEVNASKKATIYLEEGIYTGENNTDLNIDLAHQTNGGNLTIIGKGNGKTIIDANYEAPIFKSISKDSIVTLINITFIHGKGDYGSAISNGGFLTIDSCEFFNNEASSYGTVYQSQDNNLTVLNSKFANNAAYNGADIYFGRENYLLTLINNQFENSSSSSSWAYAHSVLVENGKSIIRNNIFKNMVLSNIPILCVRYNNDDNVGNIIGNTFINCSHTDTKGILFIQNSYLSENSFVNCTADGGYIFSNTDFNAYVTFEDCSVNGTSFTLNAKITDDKGNSVRNAKVQFYIGDEKVGEGTSKNGLVSINIQKLLENGNYVITGNSISSSGGDSNPFVVTVNNATLTVNFDHSPIDLWISPNGDDENGNGNFDNPFKTIKHALDYGLQNHIHVIVHLLNGLYNETGDFALSYSNVAKINLFGESKEGVVISGNNQNTFLTSGVYTEVLLKNLTIKNLSGSNSFNVRYITFENCVVDNVKRLSAQNNPSHVVFRNVRWTNSQNLMIYNAEIYNSHFENISSSGTGNFWLATVNDNDVIVIENSKFINMNNTGYSGGGVFYIQGNFRSINNTYENNTAKEDYGAIYVSGNKIISINDTFKNNKAGGDYGAGAFFVSGDNPSCIIQNAKFIANTAEGNGGGLAIYGGELINCTFEDNIGVNGGAIYAPTHSNYIKLSKLTLTNVSFKNNNANNGNDIFIAPSNNANSFITELPGMTVTFNDLTTKELYDTVSAKVTHESGAIIGGGLFTFMLNGSRIGESNLINGRAEFSYLGFKDGIYKLSGSWNNVANDTRYVDATVTVNLNKLDDNVTLYVSSITGNDETGDGSLDKPFKTIGAALDKGYTKSQVIFIHVLEGNYVGAGNTNITTFSSLDISIIGDGRNKTIVNGENKNWFMKILAGMGGSIKIYNMTFVNISTNYMPDRKIGTSAFTTENGSSLLVDGVNFISCHGNDGGAILSKGILTILNSYFFNNGDSNYGGAINSEGWTYINNSTFIGNHAKWGSTIYSTGTLYFSNSIIQDSMRVNGMSGDSVAIGAKGNITIINSKIFRSGKTATEIIGTGHTWANNPYFVVGVAAEYLTIINSTFDGYDKSYSTAYATSAIISPSITWNTAYRSPIVLKVYNSKFYNTLTVIAGVNGNALFDNCLFENITNFATTGARITVTGNVEVKNSYFVGDSFKITKIDGSNFTLNNNWWGNNAQPTYTEANVQTHPDKWLILVLNTTEDGNAILSFKSFDGENITDYDGEVYAREFTIDAVNATLDVKNGNIKNSVVIPLKLIADEIYINATVDGQNVNLTRSNADISATTSPVHVGMDVIVEITNPNDLKNNITVIIDGNSYSSAVTGGKTTIIIPNLAAGNYTASVVYTGDDKYLAKSIPLEVKVIDIIIKVEDVEKYFNGPQKLNITVTDSEGAILANQKVIAVIGDKTFQVTTDANGKASFDLNMSAGKYVAKITLNSTNTTANVVIKSTTIPPSDEPIINGDNGFEIKFVNSEGKPLANTPVTFEVDGKEIIKVTDANGVAKLTKEEIGAEGATHVVRVLNPVTNEILTFNVSLSKPAPVEHTIVLKAAKKTIKIKRSAKKLSLKAGLKIDGKKVKGKIIKLKFNGKTYKAKTNKKGIAKFKINKKVVKKLKKGKKYAAKFAYGKKTAKTIVKVK